MAQSSLNICSALPKSITKQISTCENSEHYITNFLQNTIPSNDVGSIEDELRKTLILAKHKNKWNKKKKCKGKLLSNRKRKQLGLRKIICSGHMKYKDLLSLNRLWLNYMQEVLGNKLYFDMPKDPIHPYWEYVNQQLMKADFHGAEIKVVESKCPSLIGLSGIVIQDTKNTYKICGKDDAIRTIPKDVAIITVYLDNSELEFFGRDLSIRPTERTIKKLKCGRVYEL